jgi:hypothetical protein
MGDDPELLAAHSPLSRAAAIRAPLLVGHGANDPRVAEHCIETCPSVVEHCIETWCRSSEPYCDERTQNTERVRSEQLDKSS